MSDPKPVLTVKLSNLGPKESLGQIIADSIRKDAKNWLVDGNVIKFYFRGTNMLYVQLDNGFVSVGNFMLSPEELAIVKVEVEKWKVETLKKIFQ